MHLKVILTELGKVGQSHSFMDFIVMVASLVARTK